MRPLLIALIAVGFVQTRAQDSLALGIESIYTRYQIIAQDPKISELVQLDQDLRHLFSRFPPTYEQRKGNAFYREVYSAMGVYIGHYSELAEYSGKLLADAHRINPTSTFRKYTLYSVAGCESEMCSMPNIDSAYAYVSEFPNGPFIYEVYLALAGFYDDLFKVIRSLQREEEKDYKYDCYSSYISLAPLATQLNLARENGLKYFDLAIKLKPKTQNLIRARNNLRDGKTSSWYFCYD